jgi:hypothetical protein
LKLIAKVLERNKFENRKGKNVRTKKSEKGRGTKSGLLPDPAHGPSSPSPEVVCPPSLFSL